MFEVSQKNLFLAIPAENCSVGKSETEYFSAGLARNKILGES